MNDASNSENVKKIILIIVEMNRKGMNLKSWTTHKGKMTIL